VRHGASDTRLMPKPTPCLLAILLSYTSDHTTHLHIPHMMCSHTVAACKCTTSHGAPEWLIAGPLRQRHLMPLACPSVAGCFDALML
jgi:hypothetical protein